MDTPVDPYRTIASPAEASVRIQRSEFRAFAYPLGAEESFSDLLRSVEKKHFDATHHCWGYRLLIADDVRARSSDAGEPSGTAGKPILSAIESAELYDVAVIVVRWFGGVKLGTGGLGRAYREAAQQALATAPREDRYRYHRFEVEVPFESMSAMYRLMEPPEIILREESFDEQRNIFSIDVRSGRAEEFARTLSQRRLPFRRP